MFVKENRYIFGAYPILIYFSTAAMTDFYNLYAGLLTQENHAVDHQLTVHEHDWYGQIYSADQQCQMYLGPVAYMYFQ